MIADSICAVVPVYHAQGTLEALVEGLVAVFSGFREYQIVLVDDHSRDNSFEIIKKLCADRPFITGVRLAQNCGQQCAVFCGLRFSRCAYTVVIDDDLEQDPADIIRLYHEIRKGYDAVYGIGETKEKGLFRGIGTGMRDLLLNLISKKPKDKKVCSFRIMSRAAVDQIIRADTRFVYISLEMLKYTNRISNISVRYRTQTQSNYRPLTLMKLFGKMVVYYAPGAFWKPFRKKGPCYEIEEVLQEGKL
jgi:undecaprenyl-phosphate 4-deoxy-4-formamido-L-arabinose transferase